jgi:cellulose synthase/poly-beta-1,6-N-acetylglucosamine synthase-like glycosyltransferase
MIAGPVAFKDEISLFEKMQSLELGALMLSTAGSIFLNKPVMCNGANLAYSRKAFLEVNGFEGVDHLASGDDVLLMYKIEKEFPGGIKFLKDEKAIVQTNAKKNVKEFFEQRKRWASKGLNMLNPQTKMVAVITYLCSFSLLGMIVLTVIAACWSRLYLGFLQISLILIGIKCIIDFLLLFLAASFFGKKRFLYLFLPEQIIYIFYVVVTGFLGNKGRYEWKGRKIN